MSMHPDVVVPSLPNKFIAHNRGACMYIHHTYYIFTCFGGRRHLWAVQAKLLAGSPTHVYIYIYIYIYVCVFWSHMCSHICM